MRIERAAPPAGAEVMAGETPVGTMGASANGAGLALLRLDKVEEALAAGREISAPGVSLSVVMRP